MPRWDKQLSGGVADDAFSLSLVISAKNDTSFFFEFLSRCRMNSRLVTILTSLPFSDFS